VPSYNDERIERLTRRVAVDSAGIPLLVTVLEAVAGGLEFRQAQEGWPKPGRTLDETLPGDLPDSVVGAIRVMFGRASDDGQALLIVAAVLGGRRPAALLGRGGGLEGNRLAAALDELGWSRWLTAEPRGYAFVARMFRDVIDRDMVQFFQEKPQVQGGWINGGFFVFEPAVLPLIAGDDESLEQSLLMKLTGMRQLAVYQHHGFWRCMDTPREMDLLTELWRQDKAAWAAWR